MFAVELIQSYFNSRPALDLQFTIHCSDFPSALPGVYEQTVRETEKLLQERGLNQLTSQQRDLLKGQTEGITSPDHTVFNLISKYSGVVLYLA